MDQIADTANGREHWSQGRARERHTSTKGHAQRELSPKPLVWKMRGAEFCEFLQPAGLNRFGVLKASRLARMEPRGHSPAPGEKTGKKNRGRQCGNSGAHLGHTVGDYSLF